MFRIHADSVVPAIDGGDFYEIAFGFYKAQAGTDSPQRVDVDSTNRNHETHEDDNRLEIPGTDCDIPPPGP
ncbi:MAG: hypothetical protein ABIP53_03310 [Candidatus Limnocylindrales bacterium]